MKIPLLKKVAKLLNKTFHVDDFMDNALAVSFSQTDKPFALLIVEEDSPDVLNYSVAVDAVDPYSIADVALRLISICKLDLSEPFFIDTSGEIYWSDEAYAEFMALQPDSDGTQAFLNLESPSKLVN